MQGLFRSNKHLQKFERYLGLIAIAVGFALWAISNSHDHELHPVLLTAGCTIIFGLGYIAASIDGTKGAWPLRLTSVAILILGILGTASLMWHH